MESITNEIYERKISALAMHLDFCSNLVTDMNMVILINHIRDMTVIVKDLQSYEISEKSK